MMDKDRVKGTVDELIGSAKQKAGDLTGDPALQLKGIVQEKKGNLENAWGKARDIVREANKKAGKQHDIMGTDGKESK